MASEAYQVEGSLEASGTKAEVRAYALKKEHEYPVCVSNYVLAYVFAKPKNYIRTRWRIQGDGEIYQPAMLTLLPSNVNLYAYSAPAFTRAVVCEIDKTLFESVTGVNDWPKERISRAMASEIPSFPFLFQRYAQELLEPGFASAELSDHLAQCVLIELGRELSESTPKMSSEAGLADWQLRRIDEQVRDFSEGRQKIKIAQLATSCGISARHLMRSFKQQTGTTIFRHMEQVRLDETKRLLGSGQLPLKTIAVRMGFSSSAHLSSAFKHLTGFTPTGYRNSLDS